MKEICLSILLILFPGSWAEASDYRVTMGFGFGGTGITRNSSTTSVVTGTVQRSEGPGVVEIALERIITDQILVSVSHARGFRLAPASSGVGFTGVFGRYYLSPMVWGEKEIENKTNLWIKRFQPYVGVGAGLAKGSIERTGDLVPLLEASGLFVGARMGADLPLNRKGMGLRTEIGLSFTGTSNPPDPSSLSLFFGGFSLYFPL